MRPLHLRAINDAHGHGTGDAVLKAVGEVLQTDPHVHAFRLGGEEFVLLCAKRIPNCGPNAAARRSPPPSQTRFHASAIPLLPAWIFQTHRQMRM
ncbi:diguanylate cyclase domain-containing protein [Rhizobium leguminosarum]|uniref:diguanylate cyclase domain-containing protein n=1 Tax=Rhizobium leguminosarum TaxID=384 RepID=UPI0021BBC215|nr:diguanylate cyclase [Rhizobium leguminosarum]